MEKDTGETCSLTCTRKVHVGILKHGMSFQGNAQAKYVGGATAPLCPGYASTKPADVDGGTKKRGSRFEILIWPTFDLTCVFV